MDSMIKPFEQLAKHVTYKTPKIPVISPLLNTCVFDGKTINEKYLSKAARETVNFVGALESSQEIGIIDEKTIWIEIGPHPVNVSFVRGFMAAAQTHASFRRDEDNYVTLSKTLTALHRSGVTINWNEYHRPFESSLKLLHLHAYRWNAKNYWIQYEGTWTLDKAYPNGVLNNSKPAAPSGSALRTSSMQQILSEEISEDVGRVVVISDMMQPELLGAVDGHHMNGYGVATSVSDQYLYSRWMSCADLSSSPFGPTWL
jgi:asperthecin polyketide synthase